MRNLLRTLTAQHGMISERIHAVEEALEKGGEVNVVQRRLAEMQATARAHLDLEERQLYPAALAAALERGEEDLARRVRAARLGTAHLALALRAICDRYLGKRVQPMELRLHMAGFADAFGTRFGQEETELYRTLEGLDLAEPTGVPESERRQLPRVPCGGSARAVAPWALVGRVKNISPGGLCFQVGAPLFPVGDRFQLTFLLPGVTEPLAAEAEVCSHIEYPVEFGGPAMGLRFVKLPGAAQAAVGKFVSQRA